MQLVEAVAPVKIEVEPAEQAVHDDAPVLGWYIPLKQLVQALEPAMAKKPAAHAIHVDDTTAPTIADIEPEGQLVHDDAPRALW